MGPKIGVEIELRRHFRSSLLRKQQKFSELRDKIGVEITLCFRQESELSSDFYSENGAPESLYYENEFSKNVLKKF